MTHKHNGGPAFPYPHSRTIDQVKGISVRQYYAAKAMQGILSNGALCDDGSPEQIKYVRDTAFAVADAMLAQRERDSDDQ